MNDEQTPRQARRLTPTELDIARSELAAADPNSDYHHWRIDEIRQHHPIRVEHAEPDSTPTRRAQRTGLLLAAIVAFWGTVAVATWGDPPVFRAAATFVGILAVAVLTLFAFLGDDQ